MPLVLRRVPLAPVEGAQLSRRHRYDASLRMAKPYAEQVMAKYVIGCDVALHLAQHDVRVSGEHQLLAPTLLRSQVLSCLYQSARGGEITRTEADRRLGYLRGLRIRLLGDRSLQQQAWRIAEQLGWTDTWDAEYIALTQLQADAFITLDPALAQAVQGLVRTVRVEAVAPAG